MKIFTRFFRGLVGITTALLCLGAADEVNAAAQKISAPTLRRSVSHFNWSYYDVLPKDKNIFYSPYSLDAALGMLVNGAAGDTKLELCQALGVNTLNALNEDHLAFRQHLRKDYGKDITLTGANLFLVSKERARKGIGGDFRKSAQKFYGAEIRTADFARRLDKEKDNIQKWVDKNTNHFIPDYESIATAQTVSDLINAVYFNGVWDMPFQEEWTKDDFFTNLDGQRKKISMMRRTFENEVSYYADGRYQGVILPYGRKKQQRQNTEPLAAMYLILPQQEKNLTIAADWSKEPLNYRQEFLQKMRQASRYPGEVDVMLPKLNLDLNNQITDALKDMGIERAFGNNAQFPAIVRDTKIYLGGVQHRAKLKIDEEGTEAAAVTEISLAKGVAKPAEPTKYVPFFCNRPFILIICDNDTQVELFTGVINEQ